MAFREGRCSLRDLWGVEVVVAMVKYVLSVSPLGLRGGDRRRDDEGGEGSEEDAGERGKSGEAESDFLRRLWVVVVVVCGAARLRAEEEEDEDEEDATAGVVVVVGAAADAGAGEPTSTPLSTIFRLGFRILCDR